MTDQATKKILLVDDDASFCQFIEAEAKAHGITLTVVHTLKEGEEAFNTGEFAACIIDGYLPDGEGLKLIRKISEKNREIPIAFVSVGYNDSDSFKRLKKEFAIDFVITKPIKEEELKKVFELLIREKVPEVNTQDMMGDLVKEYSQTIPEKIRLVEDLIRNFQDHADKTQLRNLKETLHKIAGSSGTYGFMDVSKLSKEMEQNLKKKLDEYDNQASFLEWNEELSAFFRSFKLAFQIPHTQEARPTGEPPPQTASQSAIPLEIYIVDDDPDFLSVMEKFGRDKGFTIHSIAHFDAAMRKMKEVNFAPDFLVIDKRFGDKNGFDLIRAFKESHSKEEVKTEIVMVSASGEQENRIEAQSLGVSLFFQKPLNPDKIYKEIERLGSKEQKGTYQGLVIDDDEDFSKLVVQAVSPLGVQMETLNNGKDLISQLEKIKPDFLLLDINLPGENGLELLRLIRTDFRYKSLPILIVSGEGNEENFENAYNQGIADFIQKPLSEKHLQLRIKNFLRSLEKSSSLKDRDFNTGLYQKHVVQDLFHLVVAQNQMASIALIQLRYEGDDRVREETMKSLADLLGTLFRKHDVVGLWSDIQIILIFPNNRLNQTKLLIEELFNKARLLPMFKGKEGFNLVGGAVAYPEHGDNLDALVRMAQEQVDFAMQEGGWKVNVARHSDRSLNEKFSKKCVVIVDDDEDIRSIVSHALQGKGIKTEEFPDGESFLKWLQDNLFKAPPHLIILDWMLPGIAGIEVLTKVKEMLGDSVPVILLSSLSQESNILQALQKGAVEYLTKPFSTHILIEKVRENIA